MHDRRVNSCAHGVDAAVGALGALGNAIKGALPGITRDAAIDVALAAVPVVGEIRAEWRIVAINEAVDRSLSENRHVAGINATRKNFESIGSSADDVMSAIANQSGWQSVTAGGVAGGRIRIGSGTVQYTLKRLLNGETVANAGIPK